MPAPSFAFARWWARWRKAVLLGAAGLAGAGLAVHWGYRVPWFDKHPDWPEFPGQTNPRFVVEEVPDFEQRYGRRFPEPCQRPGAMYFSDHYRTNLRNLHFLGYRVTENEFDSGFHPLRGTWGSGNSTIHPDAKPSRTEFINRGYAYFRLTLGTESSYFKDILYADLNNIKDFYQYNCPLTSRDTLYLRSFNTVFRVYLR